MTSSSEAPLDPVDPPAAPADLEPTPLRLRANGLEISVLAWGPSDGPRVLFQHGWLDLAWGLAPVTTRLARAGFHVLAPDLRGHGDSDRVGAGGHYHVADYLLDLAELLQQLGGVELLVGHSLGGLVVSLYAGTYPDRVARLALLEGVGPPAGPVGQSLDQSPAHTARWIATTRWARDLAPPVLPSLDAVARRLRSVDPRCPPELALELAPRAARAIDGGFTFKHDLLHLTRGPNPFHVAAAMTFWRAVRCPTLLIDAAASEMRIDDLEDRYACFTAARRVTIPDAGHMLIRHRPELVAAALIDFLAPGR